ncbi:MAG TPA: DUF4156 domain-containing protein [Pseudomonadales bacterium]|nr:DUF4156 domain-containing protein [Pseudomonadales bacterium]
MVRRPLFALGVVAAASIVGACSWVQLTAGGDRVRVATPADVASCEEIGTASGTTEARFFGLIPRDQEVIRDEQTRLARNRAADLGGNTIVEDFPTSRPTPSDGPKPSKDTLTFLVYRCS